MAYSFPRGTTIALSVLVIAGDPTIVSTATGSLRPALATDPTLVDPAQSAAASFTVSLQPAASDGSYPARWTAQIAPGVSAGLAIGNYIADLRLTYPDGSVVDTPQLQVSIFEPATTA